MKTLQLSPWIILDQNAQTTTATATAVTNKETKKQPSKRIRKFKQTEKKCSPTDPGSYFWPAQLSYYYLILQLIANNLLLWFLQYRCRVFGPTGPLACKSHTRKF